MSGPRHQGRADPAGSNVIEAMTPPWSEKCEQCLISSVLADQTGGAVSIAQQCGVRPAAFYLAANNLIWEVLEDLATRRIPLSLETLTVELQARGKLDNVSLPQLLQSTGEIGTSLDTRHFAAELVLLWQRRHALTLAAELREQAMEFEDREKFVEFCGGLGRKLVGLGHKPDLRTLAQRIDLVKADVEARSTGTDDRTGWIMTGLPTFDARLRPLNSAREDQIIVVAGGSGDGKSALMRQLGNAALEQRMRTVFFTRETTVDGCIEQMAATAAGFDLMHPDRMLPEVKAKFMTHCDRMRDEWADKLLFCYEHSPNQPLITIEDLMARARHHCWTHGVPHLVVVDYLQLFESKRKSPSREQDVARVSHELQALARELGCATLIGCQMNEKGLAEMRAVRRENGDGKVIHRIPNAGDLRESQAIYHDADRVIAIYRPPVDSRDQDQTGPNIDKPEQWLCQIKRRKGGTGIVKCRFEKPFTRFTELPSASQASAVGSGGGQTKAQWRAEHGGKS